MKCKIIIILKEMFQEQKKQRNFDHHNSKIQTVLIMVDNKNNNIQLVILIRSNNILFLIISKIKYFQKKIFIQVKHHMVLIKASLLEVIIHEQRNFLQNQNYVKQSFYKQYIKINNQQTNNIMQRLRKFINQKIIPQIRKRRINSYQVFCEFKRILIPKRVIKNQFFLTNHQLDFTQQIVLRFMTLLLKKKPEQRTQLQKQSLYKCFSKISYFFQLEKQTEPQVIKSLIKNSRIIRVEKKAVIFDEGDQIQNYYVVLRGSIGILQNSYKSQMYEKIQAKLIQQLIKNLLSVQPTKSSTSRKRQKQKIKQEQPQTFQTQQPIFQMHKLQISQLKIAKVIETQQSFGDQTHNVISGRKISAVAIQNCYLLQINLSNFLRIIKLYNQKQMSNQILFFRRFKCFQMFQDNQLRILIQASRIQQRSRNQYIFKQGQQSKQFYLLIQGEIKINKIVKLFIQNPNILYANRSTYSNKKQINILPFANFQNLYNYRPKQEIIQMGIFSTGNMFGQQEVFLNEVRQTNTCVISAEAKYYVLDPLQIEKILRNKKAELEDFKAFMFATTTKNKILYRQSKLSQVLVQKNKKKLDYFYLDNDQTQQKNSPRKYQIQKINNKVTNTYFTNRKSAKQQQKACFTTFNFNKFMDQEQFLEGQSFRKHETPLQKSILELTHTDKDIDRKISSHCILKKMKKIPYQKQQLDLKNPLFQQNYFSQLIQVYKKMDQEDRKRRFSVIRPNSGLLKSTEKTRAITTTTRPASGSVRKLKT